MSLVALINQYNQQYNITIEQISVEDVVVWKNTENDKQVE